MAEQHILASLLPGFAPHIATLTVDAFHKIGFDLDTIGREREIAYLEERTRLEYEKAGMRVNIAIWNMHIPIDGNHYFEQILESGLQSMERGGGFRIVAFRGNGLIKNNGACGFDNWRCSGNQTKDGNTITFQPV
ncbi:hypothetical protein COCCADRAFT_42062 [Bipolaris zeicola 26-R-13]|uniref:Uncharacterized protein n=1 Tax=Cochliobolus carbonum (strain 26-R-13) TaxID=930089 RepID=W6XNM7_COCC2|nr:uncharacterized protein COCCADRAFT_42062 [Bipolaris zeicola 26-R-13]EUC27103.1 hypothetical protein COCCADRAFT_42062 [Bipolaris zeicola 26-R-13]